MSKITTKRFKKLQKELDYWESELEYIQEILKEWHYKFEEYHRQYCFDNKIDLKKLNADNGKRIAQIIPKPVNKKAQFEDKTDEKHFKKVYKQLARKLHPDLGGDEEEFKEVVTALEEKNFKKILDICDKHDIIIEMSEELNKILEKQIEGIKQKINKEKSTYSWSLYSCGTDEKCKERVVRNFLKHLFNYQVKKIVI
jgi:Glu-tRNA(Gln) amidotransferase subunit E-like FAD-binding protein